MLVCNFTAPLLPDYRGWCGRTDVLPCIFTTASTNRFRPPPASPLWCEIGLIVLHTLTMGCLFKIWIFCQCLFSGVWQSNQTWMTYYGFSHSADRHSYSLPSPVWYPTPTSSDLKRKQKCCLFISSCNLEVETGMSFATDCETPCSGGTLFICFVYSFRIPRLIVFSDALQMRLSKLFFFPCFHLGKLLKALFCGVLMLSFFLSLHSVVYMKKNI